MSAVAPPTTSSPATAAGNPTARSEGDSSGPVATTRGVCSGTGTVGSCGGAGVAGGPCVPPVWCPRLPPWPPCPFDAPGGCDGDGATCGPVPPGEWLPVGRGVGRGLADCDGAGEWLGFGEGDGLGEAATVIVPVACDKAEVVVTRCDPAERPTYASDTGVVEPGATDLR
jgi:hypothetical protein